jgi:hypothetical protein
MKTQIVIVACYSGIRSIVQTQDGKDGLCFYETNHTIAHVGYKKIAKDKKQQTMTDLLD